LTGNGRCLNLPSRTFVKGRSAVSRDFLYETTTHGVRIRVRPEYEADQSSPDEGYYFWTYTVEIANEGGFPVQLKTRFWRITDSIGRTEEVRGPGVVGQTPVIDPGQSFTYTSGCPLSTPSGIMVGSYQMAGEGGRLFDVAIPAFSLDSPFTVKSVN
jgi:ApaG protein